MKLVSLTIALSLVAASQAAAQRADENAIANAEDAFGSNDGGEDLGLYGPADVRGFSPIDAGNVRIEGLYIDRQADLSARLVAGNRIRVGLTAAGYGLPAPSGIVDYRLRQPEGPPSLSTVFQTNSFGGGLVEIDGHTPLSGRLSLGGGASVARSEYASGNNADVFQGAVIAALRITPNADVRAFWSGVKIGDEDIFPIIQGDGKSAPDKLVRRRFLGQDWADVETERMNAGLLARGQAAGLAVRAGLFYSVTEVLEGHSVFLKAAPLGEPAGRSVSAYPGRRAASASGEIGLAKVIIAGAVEHRIALITRGRSQMRRHGGAVRATLPDAPFGMASPAQRPYFDFTPQSLAQVDQWSAGLSYSAALPGWGRLSAGLQKLDYEKTVIGPGAPRPATQDRPWLYSLALVTDAHPLISLYASIATGLEESVVAPETATNRDEAPPAIRTRQIDGGVRLKLNGYTLVGGGFEITRPYFGTDASGHFGALGEVRHRGVETSITGSPVKGLTLVAGGLWLSPRVSGQEVLSGQIGKRPIATPTRKVIGSLDWRAPGSPLSLDLSVEHFGPAWADSLNRVEVGAHTVVDLGGRYRFRLHDRTAVLRLQATNLLGDYSWDIVGDNSFVYSQPRQLVLRLTVDW
ncbi:TonB-dependent receptor domain-containing protein [Caulobacter sp. UNC358MFTsu5.1]|uniref:TonB-dependent receptor domain-containing protein n=1 Tax=Caulobacter sp. UNC358MFTsu5.1 TaxID=1449049 RepID=UPI0005561587|nr:TonB-dependent receptor [Caulobacter sp. UNC358MFTsu5.1]